MYKAYISEIKNIRIHSNADRLQVGECFGNQIIVSLEANEGDLGIYFPTDGRLGIEYAKINNLVRKKDDKGNNIGGYLDPEKRHVSSLKLRGEISDGLFMPIKSLESFTDISKLKIGDVIDILDGVLICEKYIPKTNKSNSAQGTPKTKKEKTMSYPLFKEHVDTSQYSYNKNQFKENDLITISLKMHGTSQRTSNSLESIKPKQNFINNLLIKLKLKKKIKKSWNLVSGTRRVILKNYEGGYYGTNSFRKQHHDFFEGKLNKGETVYYEVVGYTDNGKTIMPKCSNKKMNDKDFVKKFGKETVFSYGCIEGTSDIYVYRMTLTNEDGYTIEYPTSLINRRCEQMGVKICPILDQFFYTTQDDLEDKVSEYHDGVDPIGLTHIREGCVIRIENKDSFKAFKHKNYNFKILEGIIKSENILDIEEQESLENN